MSASEPRLLLQSLSIAPLHLLVDVHTAGGSRHVPITVDTHRWAHSPFRIIQVCMWLLSTLMLRLPSFVHTSDSRHHALSHP